MTARSRPTAVLIAALVVLSTVVGGVAVVSAQDGTGSATNATSADDTGVSLPPADDIYVKDNGDVVLAYEDEAGEGRVSMGLDISKGLFHTLVVANQTGMAVPGMSNVTGNATTILTPSKLIASGNLSVPRPEALSSLSVNVTGKRTDEIARSDATISATITPTNARLIRTIPIKNARLSGNVTIGASNLSAAVEAHATLSRPLGISQHQEFRITEQGGSYTLSASQEYTVSSFAAQQWNTRQRAKQTLRMRYVSIAKSLGGSADLKLESYSFTKQRQGYRLDIEYTVTYHGIERVLTNQLVTRLSTSGKVSLNQSETDAIVQRLRNLTVKEVYVSADIQGRSIDAVLRVDLRNYDDVVFAALKIAQSANWEKFKQPPQFNINDSLDQFRKQFEARQAANLTQRYTFSMNISKKSSRTVAVNAELHYRTKNWAQYVNELEKRGLTVANVHYELHATTEGGRVNATVALEISSENLLRQVSKSLLNATRVGDSTGPAAANAKMFRKYIKAFRNAGFQKARMDISFHDGRIRFEAGAAFKNMSALRGLLINANQAGSLQSAIIRTENDTATGYVRLKGAVSGDATKEDVRNLPYVNSDTTIHMPDSWDKKFPTTNTSQAKSYLELSGSSSGLGPGFGIVVAVVALLAAALVAVRRRR